jgi:hypothetical protein
MHVIGSLAGMFEVMLPCSSHFCLITTSVEASYLGGTCISTEQRPNKSLYNFLRHSREKLQIDQVKFLYPNAKVIFDSPK